MFKIFGSSKTTKFDVVMAVAAAVVASWKAVDSVKEYREQQNQEDDE